MAATVNQLQQTQKLVRTRATFHILSANLPLVVDVSPPFIVQALTACTLHFGITCLVSVRTVVVTQPGLESTARN